MEQQTVTISKAGIHASLNARCAVAAAANPVYGSYDPNRPPMHNIGLPDSLLSRFDLLFIVLDKKEPESDRRISKHVLSQHSQRSGPGVKPAAGSLGDPDAAKSAAALQPTSMFVKADGGGAAEGDDARLSTAFIKKYVHFAKMRIHPKLTDEASKRITMLYADLRAKVDDGKGRTLPVTARTLETIIRLSSAHAKAHLRNLVTAEDADAAMKLLNFAIFSEEVAAAEARAAGNEEAAKDDMDGDMGGGVGGSARADAGSHAAAKPSAGGALVVAKARKALVLTALNTLFDSSAEEEVAARPPPSLTPARPSRTCVAVPSALTQPFAPWVCRCRSRRCSSNCRAPRRVSPTQSSRQVREAPWSSPQAPLKPRGRPAPASPLASHTHRFDWTVVAVLRELEEDNHIMYRDGAIHRI